MTERERKQHLFDARAMLTEARQRRLAGHKRMARTMLECGDATRASRHPCRLIEARKAICLRQ